MQMRSTLTKRSGFVFMAEHKSIAALDSGSVPVGKENVGKSKEGLVGGKLVSGRQSIFKPNAAREADVASDRNHVVVAQPLVRLAVDWSAPLVVAPTER